MYNYLTFKLDHKIIINHNGDLYMYDNCVYYLGYI